MRKTQIPIAVLVAALMSGATLDAQVLTGLQLWLKPEGLTNTVNLSKVSFWANSVGPGNDATNGIAANQPLLLENGLNGHPVVRFIDNGASAPDNPNLNWLVSPLPLNGNSNSFTAVIVAESQLTGERDTLLQQLGNGTTILYFTTNAAPTPTPTLNSFASAQGLATPYFYSKGSWKIIALVQDAVAGTLTLYENGNAVATTAIGTLNTLADAGWLLGCNKNRQTHGLNGDIAEVLIYDAALSGGDVGTTTYYLAQKYGFVVLTDNFDTPDTSDLDQDIASRQTGFLAPQAYDWTLANIAGNRVSLSVPTGGFQAQSFCPDTNVFQITGKDFQVSYDIPHFVVTDNVYLTWAGVVINSTLKPVNPITPDGLSVIIFTNGARIFFLNGAQLYGNNPGGVPGDPDYATLSVHPPYHVDISVTDNTAVFKVTGTNAFGVTNLVDVIPLTCPVGNYVSLSIGGQIASTVEYDNLTITASPKAVEIIPPLTSPPTLLLADTFDVADTADLDDGLAGRQSGAAATIPYTTVGIFNATASIQGNQLVLNNTPPADNPSLGIAAPNLDFRLLERASSFRLRCTMKPVGSVNEWAGIRFRENFAGVFVADNNNPGVGFIVRGNGDWAMFLVGSVIAQGSAGSAPDYTLDVEVRENVMRATLNGLPLSVGCGETSFVLPPTQTRNYITLESYANQGVSGFYATFDNLEVYSLDTGNAAPKPLLQNPAYLAGSTNAFRFDFLSVPNAFYVVDRKTDLGDTAWSDVLRLYGTGGLEAVTNSPITGDAGFYRLRVP